MKKTPHWKREKWSENKGEMLHAGFNFGTPRPIYEMYELVKNVNFTLIQVGLRWRKQQRLKIFGSMGSLVPPGQQNPSHHRWFSPKPWLSWLPWWDVTMTAGWPPCFPGGFWISSLVATFVVESYWALQPSAPLLNRWKCILCFLPSPLGPSSSSPPLFLLPNRFSFFVCSQGSLSAHVLL